MMNKSTYLEGNANLADVATRDAIFEYMHLYTAVQKVERSLQYTHVCLDTKQDDVLDTTCLCQPVFGDARQIHAKLGLCMYRLG